MTLDPALRLALLLGGALLFLSAAAHKLRRPGTFRAALADYALLPRSALTPAVWLLAGIELAVGAGCALEAFAGGRGATAAGVALLGSYSAAVAFNLARGRRAIDCGCGGPGGPRPLGPDLLVRNALLMAALAAAALPVAPRSLGWLDAVSAGGFLLTGALLYAAFDVAFANAARLRALGET